MDDSAPPRRTEADIAADLAVADAEIAAGLTVPAADVLADLDTVIARMRGKTPVGTDRQ